MSSRSRHDRHDLPMPARTEITDLLAGLAAAAAVERTPHITRAQQHAARAGLERRILDAVEAGASVDEVAAVLDRSPATVAERLRRARRDARSTMPADLATVTQIAAGLQMTSVAVHQLRKAGTLAMHRRDGWWVAHRADVDLLAQRLRRPSPVPRRSSLSDPARPVAVVAAAATARAWWDVPRCHRCAPPPWPVHLRCTEPIRHDGQHGCLHRGDRLTWD